MRRTVLAVVLVLIAAAVACVGPTAAFHFLPPGTTGEEARLAAILEIAPGQAVADIGAGDGDLSMAIARRLEPGGTLYSTELDAELRDDLRQRASREHLTNVVVIEAGETATGLPDGCCDALFMRNVYHHLGDTTRYNQSLRRAARPGARVAIIDFEPGAFWFLRSSPPGASRQRTGHGVGAVTVAEELQQAGFRPERTIETWGGRMYLVLLRGPK